MKKTITVFLMLMMLVLFFSQKIFAQNDEAAQKHRQDVLHTKPLSDNEEEEIFKKYNGKSNVTILNTFVWIYRGGRKLSATMIYSDTTRKHDQASTVYAFVFDYGYTPGSDANPLVDYYYGKILHDYAETENEQKKYKKAAELYEKAADFYEPRVCYYNAAIMLITDAEVNGFSTDREKLLGEKKIDDMFLYAIEINVVKDDGNKDIYLAERGKFYMQHLKDTTNALLDFKEAVKLNPKNEGANLYLFNINFARANYNEAINNITNCVKINPTNERYYTNRALCYRKVNNYSAALTDYISAIKINPKEWKYYHNKADCNVELDSFIEAYDNYSFAVLLNKDDEGAKSIIKKLDPVLKSDYEKLGFTMQNAFQFFMDRGIVFYTNKDYAQSIMNYYKCFQVEPKNAKPYNLAGLVLKEMKLYKNALQLLQYAAALEPNNEKYKEDLQDLNQNLR